MTYCICKLNILTVGQTTDLSNLVTLYTVVDLSVNRKMKQLQ